MHFFPVIWMIYQQHMTEYTSLFWMMAIFFSASRSLWHVDGRACWLGHINRVIARETNSLLYLISKASTRFSYSFTHEKSSTIFIVNDINLAFH